MYVRSGVRVVDQLDSRSSFADLPDKAKVRSLITQAEFLSVQRTNPLKDFQIDLLIALFSERKPMTSPGKPLL